MTLSIPRFSHVGAIGLALLYTATTFGTVLAPAPAQARDHKIFYTAELAQPAKEGRAIAGGVAWVCEGTTCIAPKGTSRPLRVCRELQREVGAIATFTSKGEALEADKLARCNG